MTMPDTRSGRPNTSGTRGGQAQMSPLPLAEEDYSKDNEQKFRRQLMDILSPIQQQLSGAASAITALVASAVGNDSGVSGTTVKDALDAILASLAGKQPLDADLTAIAAIVTAAYGRSLLALASATALAAEVDSFFLTPAEGNAAYQPLDSDLTAIAALSTTATGRALLAIASAAAGFDSLAPTTTRGDLIVRGASSNGRLAIGSAYQVPRSDGTDVAWVDPAQFAILVNDYTLSNVNTAQKALNASANGAVTLAASTTYEFEAQYIITNTGTTSHLWQTLFGGAATFTSGAYVADGRTATADTLYGTVGTVSTTTPGTALSVTALSTSATENVTIKLRGILRINAGGTLIPQVQMSAAPGGTQKMLANSYFRIWPAGTDAMATVGSWS